MTRARDIADTQDNVGGAVAPFVGGKNKIINGDFAINQRGFTTTSTLGVYGFDRWYTNQIDGTTSYSAQTFTPGTAPVSGYEGKNFARLTSSGQSASNAQLALRQGIEDVRTFAGQTVTISFWAKAASGTPKIAPEIIQFFGTGGSPSTSVLTPVNQLTLSTSWARYSVNVNIPSISGKTIGTTENTSQTILVLWCSAGSDVASRTGSLGIQTNTFDIWGVQLEAGSVATPFTTASGSIGGELALCQRYYYRTTSSWGTNYTTTVCRAAVYFPVEMRIAPTALEQSGTASDYTIGQAGGGGGTCSSVPLFSGTTARFATINGFVASGLTQFFPSYVGQANSNGFLGWSAEL